VKKKFPSSFCVGDLVEVADDLVSPIEGRDIPPGSLGIILKRHGITDKHYFVYMPNGETQIMSYKWIKKVTTDDR
jgi:hypothetical protein